MPEAFSSVVSYFPHILTFFGVLYLLIVFWVAKDIAYRTTSFVFQSLSIVIVVAFPFIGLMIYLLLRPELLIHKEIREFLSAQSSENNDSDLGE